MKFTKSKLMQYGFRHVLDNVLDLFSQLGPR